MDEWATGLEAFRHNLIRCFAAEHARATSVIGGVETA
jgi:hypothetical protein